MDYEGRWVNQILYTLRNLTSLREEGEMVITCVKILVRM